MIKGIRGRRYGHIYTWPDGKLVYLAWRKSEHMFRGGMRSQTEAIVKGVAAWAIDTATLEILRLKDVEFVGIFVHDVGDIYLTLLDRFQDSKLAPVMDYTGVGAGGSEQRYMAIEHMQRIMGKTVF